MKLDDFVAVKGLPGLFQMIANRNNGLILENLDSSKRKFYSSRKYDFTPLVSIGIYTDDDTTELKEVFKTMLAQYDTNPPVETNVSADEISAYFASILPEYDRDRVYQSDIKKIIKWFNFLKGRDLLSLEEDPVEEAVTEEASAAEEE